MSSERGAVLLEVLVAVAILAMAGLAAVELGAASVRGLAEARSREREIADAERLLAAHTLLTREDLLRRLGRREVGPYIVEIQRPEPTLFRIAIATTDALERDWLVTAVFREDADAR